MASRRKARVLAFQALYSWDVSGRCKKKDAPLDVDFSWLDDKQQKALDEATRAFSSLIILGVVDNRKEIDALIKEHLQNWDIDRLKKVDLAILRMSVCQLLYQKDIAPSIVIDEAIKISKEYGDDDSFKFINGVLDAIKNDINKNKVE
ncbi:MAG: transcription antitermination factor NusB [Spirochaetaceae bacterium]|jgi:N utilization substance protein B|nr:transcription antitermination factor NusB [Spirochaetaceae bacterium]